DAYTVDEAPSAKGEMEKRTVLRLHPDLAPMKVAVLPLSRHERLVPEARRVFDLVKSHWMADYDDAGAIGRRYRRQDEVGTPYCGDLHSSVRLVWASIGRSGLAMVVAVANMLMPVRRGSTGIE